MRLKGELESRREIELALKQAKEFADRANESKTRFLAAASHDLRQPLSSALLFLESISDTSLEGLDLDYLHKARVALASLSNLLDTLLDVARLDSGAIEPQNADFPVSAVLDRIVPEFASVARSAGLDLNFVSSSAWIRTDMHLLETVLRNLISNAIRYTPRGRLLIGPATARRLADFHSRHRHGNCAGTPGAHLHGLLPGPCRTAQPHHRNRARPVDRRTDLDAPGAAARGALHAGSGLHVCRAGSLRAGRRQTAARSGDAGTAVPPHSLAIAVIDDDPGIRLGLAATLTKWGYRPIAAATATEAVVQFIGPICRPISSSATIILPDPSRETPRSRRSAANSTGPLPRQS